MTKKIFSFHPSSLEELSPISQFVYAPEGWLRERIPKDILYYPSIYHEDPYWIKEGALDAPTCRYLLEMIQEKDQSEQVGILYQEKGVVQSEQNRSIRHTYAHEVPTMLEEKFIELVAQYKSEMERFFNILIHSPGSLQLLGYKEGSFYARHSDNCSEIIDEKGDVVMFQPVAPYRMLTVILFLTSCERNGDHLGGELRFDYLYDLERNPIVVAPQAGMMLAFPSHPSYSHSVLPVKSGFRVSVVQWFNAMVM